MQKRNDSDQSEEQDEELIMEKIPEASLLDDLELVKNCWVIELNAIEPGLLLISSIRSDEFSKYVIGPDLKQDLDDLMKLLDGDLSQV